MSAATEKRNSRGPQHQRQAPSRGSTPQSQQSKPPASAPKQPPQQPAQPSATNAWSKGGTGIGRGRPVSGTSTPSIDGKALSSAPSSGTVTPTTSVSQTKSPIDQHVPAKGFNAKEISDFLQKRYASTISGSEMERECLYKPEGGAAAKRNTMGAWGTKPNAMSNGKDFWVLLAQQTAAAEGQHRGG